MYKKLIYYIIKKLNKRKIILFLFLALIYISFKYESFCKDKLYKSIHSLSKFQKELLNYYFDNIYTSFEKVKYREIYSLISLFTLKNYSNLSDEILKPILKFELLKDLQIKPNKTLNYTNKVVYVDKSFNFGNSMILLNNLLYYSEILNLTNIYLNSNEKWPIFRNISTDKFKITFISPLDSDSNYTNYIIFDKKLLYFQKIFKPEIRIHLLKDEIKNNLPKIIVDENALYIHIRSGDIFQYKAKYNINYAQPPLCFYQKILTTFIFKNIIYLNIIYLLSLDQSNPIINKLISEFPHIILTHNSLEIDSSILLNAYNIVGSVSSFLTTSLIINDNLKNFFEYDIYCLSQKYLHLHHDIYQYPIKFKIYRMKPSKNYLIGMFPWRNNKMQIYLMLNEKCGNFDLIVPS